MYDRNYLTVPQMCEFLGIGRNTCLKLCAKRPPGFPVVRVGNRYRADKELLYKWKSDWYAGKFGINDKDEGGHYGEQGTLRSIR